MANIIQHHDVIDVIIANHTTIVDGTVDLVTLFFDLQDRTLSSGLPVPHQKL